jgi:hypothetical protein
MSYQAYLDNIKAQTGKTPEDFRALAEKKGLLREGVKTSQIVNWLKEDYGLGHGHAMAIVLALRTTTQPGIPKDEKIEKQFSGNKARWKASYQELVNKVDGFGPDVSLAPTNTYISVLRKGKKFAILQVTSDHMDIGIKLKGAKATDRFEPAGTWNSMVTHRVRISDPNQIDTPIISWLHEAYDKAVPPGSSLAKQ